MTLRAQQRLLLVLAIDLDKRRADTSQVLHRGQVAIDGNPRTSAFGDKSAHQKFALRPVAIRKPFERGLAFQLKHRLHRRIGLTRADHVGGAAPAQQQAERGKNDGLAGARLTGQDIQPRTKFERCFLDDREIADPQLVQHRRFSPSAACSATPRNIHARTAPARHRADRV
jgi:hypothetical protein